MEYAILVPLVLLSYWSICKAFVLFRQRVFIPMEEDIDDHVPVVPEKVKFFGGPLDGYVDLVEAAFPFYVAPYRGKGELETKIIMGHEVQIPALAYYRQVQDNSYFYVRDISQDEAQVLYTTGIEPLTEPLNNEE
jgi:hypothetical protein